jgi:hypothetical protein
MWAVRVTWCLLVVVAMPGVGGAVAPGPTAGAAEARAVGTTPFVADGTATGYSTLRQEQPAADGTVTHVRVYTNGSARWVVQFRTRIANDTEAERYRTFQERFRNDTARSLDPFRDRIRGTVASAAAATGRPMNATDFTAATSIRQLPRRYGVVTYAFTWEGFARTDGDTVTVGDAFEGGFLLSEGDTLTFVPPPGYGVAAADPDPDRRDDGRLTWAGARSFADGRPLARFVATATDDGSDGATAETPANDSTTGVLWYYALGVVVVLAGGLVGATVIYRRRSGSDRDADGARGAAGGAAPPDPPLTDADRVRSLLTEEDGQLKQKQVAERLDWSASKTSRTLSSMEEEGTIERVRIGRENVVRLAEGD